MSHFPTSVITTVKNDLIAKANTIYNGKTLAIHQAESNYDAIAAYYNENSTDKLWKPDVKVAYLPSAVVGEEFKTTAQLQNVYFMLTQGSYIDSTQSIIRNSFLTVFPAQNSPTVANLLNLCRRYMTRFEKLFVVVNGTDYSVPNIAVPGKADFVIYGFL